LELTQLRTDNRIAARSAAAPRSALPGCNHRAKKLGMDKAYVYAVISLHIAKALNVSVAAIRAKRDLLRGICTSATISP
jgi:hypothetical protein